MTSKINIELAESSMMTGTNICILATGKESWETAIDLSII
jgi:hypothetical protein